MSRPHRKSERQLAELRRRAAQPATLCVNPDCRRPCHEGTDSGLCHRCCRQPHEPSPDDIDTLKHRIRLINLIDLAAKG